MAIMRSIVEVLKRFNLVEEAKHIQKETRNEDVDIPSLLELLTKCTKNRNHAQRCQVQMMNTRSR